MTDKWNKLKGGNGTRYKVNMLHFIENIAAFIRAAGEDESTEEAPDQVTQQVDALKARLQEAVALEEYEEAARLRDEIGRLEHSIGK